MCVCINLSRINRTTMNLLLKVSRYVKNVFANYLKTSVNRRIFFKYYYNRDFNRYKRCAPCLGRMWLYC